MKQSYKRYDFCENNGYVGTTQQLKEYLDGKFERITVDKEFIDTTIKEALKDVDAEIEETVQSSVQESLKDASTIIESTVKESVSESLQDIDEQFDKVNSNIHTAEANIIHEIIENKPCLCNLATKQDIADAVEEINTHTTRELESYNVNEQSTNLNEEIRKIQEKQLSIDPDIAKILSTITNVEEEKFKDNTDSDINKEDVSLNMGTFENNEDNGTF